MAKAKNGYKASSRRSKEILDLIDRGLIASGNKLADVVTEQWMQTAAYPGYTTGAFAEGTAADIKVSEPKTVNGKRRVDVYSPAERDGVPYPAYWELGHLNTFTGKYERVEIFRPAIERFASQYKRFFASQVKASPFSKTLSQTSGMGRITE